MASPEGARASLAEEARENNTSTVTSTHANSNAIEVPKLASAAELLAFTQTHLAKSARLGWLFHGSPRYVDANVVDVWSKVQSEQAQGRRVLVCDLDAPIVWGAHPEDWNHFERIGLGEDLLPTVCNQAVIPSPDSKVSAFGKVPSRYNRSRQGVGFADWTSHKATPQDRAQWKREPDYGICLQTRTVRAVDVDIEDNATSKAVLRVITKHMGTLPMRVRADSNKFLLLVHVDTDQDLRKKVIRTQHGIIEFLATGQQCVVIGTHPKGQRYNWPVGLPEAIPHCSLDQRDAMWLELEEAHATEASTTSKPTVTKAEKLEAAIANDPLAVHLYNHGFVKSAARDGTLNIVCPFEDEHTTEANETEARYFPAHTGGYARGHFKCLHAHCAERSDGDFAVKAGFLEDDFEDLTAADGEPSRPKRLEVLPAHERLRSHKAPSWFIKRVLPRAGLGMIYGESGSGKSFLALDVAMAIARGRPWRDHRTTKGRVVYIAAEGAAGFLNRLRAYADYNQIDLAKYPIGVVTDAPNFMVDDDRVLAKRIEDTGGADLIIDDTLAQSMIGNENAGEDMTKVLSHLKRLHATTGAMVLLVHHSGKNAARGARGWSGLRAACDFEMEVLREDHLREAQLTKLKDGEDGARFPFELSVVQIGEDDDGDPVTSCVVRDPGGGLLNLEAKPRRRLGGTQRLVMDKVHEMVDAAGFVGFHELVEAVAMAMPAGKSPEHKRRSNAADVLQKLADDGDLILRGDVVQIPGDDGDSLV